MASDQRLSATDPSSFSNPEDFKFTHIHLDLDVDFSKHVLKGKAKLDVAKQRDAAKSVVLDTRDLQIQKITDANTSKDLDFNLGDPVLSFGSKLEVQLPDCKECSIIIEYETSPNSTALQWLSPAQTAGKKHPYLFSQCQAIHARSMLPCQDTPAVKMPYTANITAPGELVVLMSAVQQGSEDCKQDPTKKVHKFNQKVPIPSYLIAIVAGALESREIGPRSKVWSEKEMVDAAAYEFAETEQMLAVAEDLMGEYVWGVYDLLVLPPSFPYGGMENPCLTFVTPTILAGDRSLADVVAHEIAHSWTGNLVTNKNPEHFWLNEGHTVFVERKIIGRLRGELSRHFGAIGGYKSLHYTVNDVFGQDHPYTHLVPTLNGVDPDDAFSTVPYEKGFNLLFYLEEILGGPDAFEPFLKAYIKKFAYQSITTDDWKSFLFEFFKDKVDILNKVDWDAWFYKPGMPTATAKYDTSLADACATLANKWASASDSELDQSSSEDFDSLTSPQVIDFLAQLLEKDPLPLTKVEKMAKLYKLHEKKNSEIRFSWLRLCLRAKDETAIPRALDFVNEQGRMKFVRPIYRDLFGWEVARDKAIDNYQKRQAEMHCLTATMVGKDLKLK